MGTTRTETRMGTAVRITRIDDGRFDAQHRFRIEGGEVDPKWLASLERRKLAFPNERIDMVPSCEFTIWNLGNQLGSYGGTVWPSAWPALFEFCAGTAQTGSYTLATPEGLCLIAAAEREWEIANEHDANGGDDGTHTDADSRDGACIR